MANTYTQVHIHLVFAVKNRDSLIGLDWRDELEKYMTAIVQNRKHKLLAIYAMRDHVHILIGQYLPHSIPELVEELKTGTNKWVKEKRLAKFRFEWQIGYGAFSHSKSQVPKVIKYILNQEEHHAKKKFKDEYLEILRNNEVDFNEKYVFDFFD